MSKHPRHKSHHLKSTRRNRGAGRRARQRVDDHPTEWEAKLSNAFDQAGIPYKRNFLVRTAESFTGFYLVDFYLPKHRVFVELDGKPHTSEAAQWKDRLRQEHIQTAMPNRGFIRFWNNEVDRDIEAVVASCLAASSNP